MNQNDNQPSWNDVLVFFTMALFLGIMLIVMIASSH